ncbi:hypothetical protein M422DRAFT_227131 [Sphaerobolus stellatus SS14]|uniref:DNA 3'-5' helicase n=1 Tax=Sphaerobolus stellatus (strain SS14) TaxID=990650 RepID=A0A0C9VSN8_SPHS4|nr:hypothetical protein M422DRAFT_227131 [Sphaerobolus stellatus SS14]
MATIERAREILQDVFQFPDFRAAQREARFNLIADKNTLVLLPTGGGKSLCFQIPALCYDVRRVFQGLTLVISPLISLMKDQVEALTRRGVKAASLDSTLNAMDAYAVKAGVLSGDLKILYVAPERLNNESFLHMMRRVQISLLAVDESHCISQWGASFRPEYLKIARFAQEMSVERVLCLTATATPEVVKDICESFNIDPKEGVFRTPIYRSNLSFQVATANDYDEKMAILVPFLEKRAGPAIVYVTLQKQAESFSQDLKKLGFPAEMYHAGMPAEARMRVQNEFMASDDKIVVATIAFGMGIDKANIRQVIHLFLPKTLENFSQEVGRAGRDGLPSDCLMFLTAEDIPILEGFARGDTCSLTSLELWLEEVATKKPAMDGSLSFNHYEQSKLYDIRGNMLGLLYAQLELDFNYIRAVTPFYANYEIKEKHVGNWDHVLADSSDEASAIRRYWKKGIMWFKIDAEDTSMASGIERELIAKKISQWELEDLIVTKATQVRHRYIVTGKLPQTHEEIGKVAKQLHERMVKKEEEAVGKIQQVITLATGEKCFAHALAEYFGDMDAVPDGVCKICTYCKTGVAIAFDPAFQTEPDPALLKSVLGICGERDDARLLARLAFGIASPRLTEMKLTKHNLFGCMVNVDFNVLVEAFQKECEAAGFTAVNPIGRNKIASSQTKKRPSTGSYGRSTSKRSKY